MSTRIKSHLKFSFAFTLSLLLISMIVLPTIAFAFQPYLGCNNPPTSGLVPCTGKSTCPCNWTAFIVGVQGLISFAIKIAIPIAAISFAYGGFLYLTYGANPGNKDKAKTIFTDTAIGFIIILVAWAAVNLITKTLLAPGFESGLQ